MRKDKRIKRKEKEKRNDINHDLIALQCICSSDSQHEYLPNREAKTEIKK
jgi:hypothetical protein